jgi:hypothetical protein
MSSGFRFLWFGFRFNLVSVWFKNICIEFMPPGEFPPNAELKLGMRSNSLSGLIDPKDILGSGVWFAFMNAAVGSLYLPGAILMLDVGRAIGSLDTLSLSLSRTS